MPTCLDSSDIFGVDVYPKAFGNYQMVSQKEWQLLQNWQKQAQKLSEKIWITEAQAEPWEIEPAKMDFKDPYRNISCNPEDMYQTYQKLKNLRFPTILLWGPKFHLRCKKENNHA